MLIPDVNVWLALTFDSHVHHAAAKIWFDALSVQICLFCRLTQQGFLRLASNQKVFGVHALTMHQAWEQYDVFRSDPYVSYAVEPTNLEGHWRRAYLAAFAQAGGFKLASFHQPLAHYPRVKCV